jgi:dipeptidyl-peptidase-3
VHPAEVKGFRGCNHIVRFIVTAIHELLGHGTGKLLTETAPGTYNFDRENLPTNPLTGKAIETWYQPGQTWTSVFGKLATSVEDACFRETGNVSGRCRAILVSYFFADNKEVLSMFNYNDSAQSPQMTVSTPGPNLRYFMHC